MRFLHLSDLHLGKRVNDFSMIEDQQYMLKKIIEIIDENNVEGIFIAGDVYDKAIPNEQAVRLYNEFLTSLSKRGKMVFVISGNHDSDERIGFGSEIFDGQKIYISPVFDGKVKKVTVKDDYGDINIYLLPFLKPQTVRYYYKDEEIESYDDAIRVVIENIKLNKNERNIILAHQFITGSVLGASEEISVGGIDNVNAASFDNFDYVALGHIHRCQKIRREEMRYCGTILKYSMAEEHHKKVAVIVDVMEKGKIEISEIPLKPLRNLRSIKGKFDDIVKRANDDENKEDYMHITLLEEDDVVEALGKLRMIYPNIMVLDYENERTRHSENMVLYEKIEEKSPQKLLKDFFEIQNNTTMTDEEIDYAQSVIERIWK